MPDKTNELFFPAGVPRSVLSAVADLTSLRRQLGKIVAAAESDGPAASINGLAKRIASKASIELRDVQKAVFALLNIRRLDTSLTGSALIGSLTEAIEGSAQEAWKEENLRVFKEAGAEFAKILDLLNDDHPINVSEKAQTLSYTQQNVLMSARLITDARPVFDESGTKILETIIVSTLAIQYSTGHHEPSLICFSLDAKDIDDLSDACERAKSKTDSITAAFKEHRPIVLPD